MVVENAHREGIKVGMCGEAAGDSKMIPLLIGMGLDELSMSSTRILKAKWIIKDLEKNKMEDLVFNTINCSTVKEVENLLL
jgi:phosphotransferase system enzyme I (PtsI)